MEIVNFNTQIQFKYQVLFHCDVPENYNIIRSFSERIQLDELPSDDLILQTISASFENSGVAVEKLELSHDNRICYVILKGNEEIIGIHIKIRESLVIGDKIYKLEELDI